MGLFLFALWLVFHAKLTLEIVVIGLLLTLAVFAFCVKFTGYSWKTELRAFRLFFGGLKYIGLVVAKTVVANIEVSKLVFSKNAEIAPRLVFFRTDLKSDLARVALAHSITLTPGTITVALNEDIFCIHSINASMAKGIDNSSFVRMLRKLERKAGIRRG